MTVFDLLRRLLVQTRRVIIKNLVSVLMSVTTDVLTVPEEVDAILRALHRSTQPPHLLR